MVKFNEMKPGVSYMPIKPVGEMGDDISDILLIPVEDSLFATVGEAQSWKNEIPSNNLKRKTVAI